MPGAWSVSRDSTLRTCERKYYYQYLSGARTNSRSPNLKEIAYLKKLKSIRMWQGDRLHAFAANWVRCIRSGRHMDVDAYIHSLASQMREEFRRSEAFCASRQDHFGSGSPVILLEHEYDELNLQDLPDSAIDQVSKWGRAWVNWVDSSGLPRLIRAGTRIWVEPPVFGPGCTDFTVGNSRVIVKVDLAVAVLDKVLEIFDWKTGSGRRYVSSEMTQPELQVGVYQLWAHLSCGYPLSAITAHVVNVAGPDIQDQCYKLESESKEYLLSLLTRSIGEVDFFDASRASSMTLEDFDFAISPAACHMCVFKRVCQRVLRDGPIA